jgi:hypothetical protein
LLNLSGQFSGNLKLINQVLFILILQLITFMDFSKHLVQNTG